MSELFVKYNYLPSVIKHIGKECMGENFLQGVFAYGNDYHLIIKIDAGETVGFSLYHFKDNICFIDCVCVLSEYRGEGYGRSLIYQTVKKAAVHGANKILVKDKRAVDSENSINSGFFEELKFVFLGEEEPYEDIANRHYICNVCESYPDTCFKAIYELNI